jgi:hypothetical protein
MNDNKPLILWHPLAAPEPTPEPDEPEVVATIRADAFGPERPTPPPAVELPLRFVLTEPGRGRRKLL